MRPLPALSRMSPLADAVGVTAIVAAVAAANAVWLSANTVPPHWDQANHMISALKYRDISATCLGEARDAVRGVVHCARSLSAVDQSVYGPLFPFVAGMFSYVAGRSVMALTLANIPFMLVLASAVYALGRALHSRAAGIVGAALLFSYPLVFAVSREFMIELSLLAMTALSVALLVATQHFARRAATLWFGVAAGLALLTKFTVTLFIAGPIVWVLLQLALDVRRVPLPAHEVRRRLISVGGAAVIAAAIAALWYVPNGATFLSTLRFVTALDPLGGSRLSPAALTFYGRAFVWEQAGPVLALLLVIGIVRSPFMAAGPRNLLLFWIASIYAVATIPSWKAEHNDIGILIPVALLSAAGITSLERLRGGVIAAVSIFGALQLATFSLPHDALAAHVGTFGYEGAARAFPRHEWWPIEQALRGVPGPARVAVVSDHPFVNGTTAEFYARADRLPLALTPCWMVSRTAPLNLTPFDAVVAKSSADWVRPKGDGCFVGPTGVAQYESVLAGLSSPGSHFSLASSSPLPDGSSLLVFRRAPAAELSN
jgi:hypothetical protein